MHSEPWTYRNLHNFLDEIFKNKTPDEEEIVQAKKTYWRSYNTRLKQTQRKKYKEITISFSKEELQFLQRKLEMNQSVSDFIKKLILACLNDASLNFTIENIQKKDLDKIEQQLFILIDYLESLLYQRKIIDKYQTVTLEKHIENLQQLLEESF